MTQYLMRLVDEYATRRIGEGTAKARAAVVDALEKLTKDAARYQWLKAKVSTGTGNDQLDEQTDCAMKETV